MKKEHIHFITGATGFVGRYLVEALLKDGGTVCVLLRSTTSDLSINNGDVFKNITAHSGRLRVIRGDITKHFLGMKDEDLRSFKNFDVTVWHLAANLSFLSKERESVFSANIEGTRNIIDFSNVYASSLHYMSTAYVCGEEKGRIEEDALVDNPHFRNNYESSKYGAEKLVRSLCVVPYIIFRPSIIIGDAYQGKAKGCTFGYYRFAFMFFVFKNWIVQMLKHKRSFAEYVLKSIGTKFDEEGKTISLPWLWVPYPQDGAVNLIPVDYVISSMVAIYKKPKAQGKTFHLVHPNPPTYLFLLQELLGNLGYKKVKYIPIPNTLFSALFRILYWTIIPWRKYFRSASWYMPYVKDKYDFSMDNMETYGILPPPPISSDFLKKVNTYAEEAVFGTITF